MLQLHTSIARALHAAVSVPYPTDRSIPITYDERPSTHSGPAALTCDCDAGQGCNWHGTAVRLERWSLNYQSLMATVFLHAVPGA